MALSACSLDHDQVLDTTPGDDLTSARKASGISEWGFSSHSDQQGNGDSSAGSGSDLSEQFTLPKRTITMAFAGDIMFEQHLLPLAQDPDALSELQSTLGAADLAVANMETAAWPHVETCTG